MITSSASTTERQRLREYDRWLRGPSISGHLFRWAMGSVGALLVNTPAFRLRENLQIAPDQRMLDIGCGRGSVMRAVDGRVHFRQPPVGIDFSTEALRLAHSDEGRAYRRSELAQASATALPFADGSFHLVTCGYLVKHLEDAALAELLDEIWRVLADGGLALLWEFAPTGNPRLDGWNRRWLTAGVGDPILRSTAALQCAAQRTGFEFARNANLRPFLLPPIPRASVLLGKPPECWQG